jgi:hypothetical protein
MKTISLEYCHVTPDTHWETEINEANINTPALLNAYEGYDIQKCIMIDDLHSKFPITPEFIQKIVDQLEVKPDCIYLESSFVMTASDIAARIDPNVAIQDPASDRDNERIWLKKVHDQYNSTNDFLMSWKKGDGSVMFSCPTLVAVSYLARLGIINVEVKPIFGGAIKKADLLVNSLSSIYMQVESNAQLIIRATHPEALRRIRWHFY